MASNKNSKKNHTQKPDITQDRFYQMVDDLVQKTAQLGNIRQGSGLCPDKALEDAKRRYEQAYKQVCHAFDLEHLEHLKNQCDGCGIEI